MNESVLEFGPNHQLIGVLTRASGERRPVNQDLAVVITNSGIIHRVGANRLHVRLARLLAAHGYTCLRYDLPGIGDSETLGTGSEVEEENLAATQAAFDTLQQLGVANRFVMIGLCSGADHSFRACRRDARIAGAVLIDPTQMFSTARHRFNQLAQLAVRGLRPHVWWRLARGHYDLGRTLREGEPEHALQGMPRSLHPERHQELRAEMVAALRSLIERDVQLYVITTGHNRRVYSYRRQMIDAFPDLPELADHLRVDRRPFAEHTFGAENDRRFLEDGILEWLDRITAPAPARRPIRARDHGARPATAGHSVTA